MESNKFEKSVREKLEKRQITPSAQSWEKLEAKLDAKKDGNSRAVWKYIAAAVAVLLVAGTFLWNGEVSDTPQIVEEPVNENIQKPEIKQEFTQEQNSSIASEENKKKEESSVKKAVGNRDADKTEAIVKNENSFKDTVSKEIAVEELVVLEEISLEPPISEEKIFQSKLEEVIAEAANNDKISEDEVDVLLAEAASELSRERNLKSYTSTNTINANALLAEVEDEIYQSFKAKVFEVLKEGYLKAKTAVANRNY
ncbi:hypothetical protein [uncultured Salegentibacter sp.]|uniref:hypothetical protein n=1 Tax=uncultured Salegentibacter sp. TaxID=259320 RepID=UPI0025923E67|nr:hypothetical protein [uncultured Salegentibacter sp.]